MKRKLKKIISKLFQNVEIDKDKSKVKKNEEFVNKMIEKLNEDRKNMRRIND